MIRQKDQYAELGIFLRVRSADDVNEDAFIDKVYALTDDKDVLYNGSYFLTRSRGDANRPCKGNKEEAEPVPSKPPEASPVPPWDRYDPTAKERLVFGCAPDMKDALIPGHVVEFGEHHLTPHAPGQVGSYWWVIRSGKCPKDYISGAFWAHVRPPTNDEVLAALAHPYINFYGGDRLDTNGSAPKKKRFYYRDPQTGKRVRSVQLVRNMFIAGAHEAVNIDEVDAYLVSLGFQENCAKQRLGELVNLGLIVESEYSGVYQLTDLGRDTETVPSEVRSDD